MANLLPALYARTIWRFYMARLILATALIFIIGAMLAALSLVPAYWTLRTSEKAAPMAPGSIDQTTQQTDRVTLISATSYTTALLAIVSASTTPSAALTEILNVKPQAIGIDRIAYTQGSIVIGGSALTPSTLEQFRSTLAANPLFKQVSVPVSALVGADQGRFTLTLTGAF